jgi:NAD-reducing hydrogenase small subunit
VKKKLATCSLAGCFGCHMSLLDIDDRLLTLLDYVDFDKTPFTDKKSFDSMVDIGYIEGGCSNEHDVEVLRDFRRNCKTMISVGECAITGNVPAMRNWIPLQECLEEAFLRGPTVINGIIPKSKEIPLLLNKVYPAHEWVKIDYFLPGCPPSADSIWFALQAILHGQKPDLPYIYKKFD